MSSGVTTSVRCRLARTHLLPINCMHVAAISRIARCIAMHAFSERELASARGLHRKAFWREQREIRCRPDVPDLRRLRSI